VSDRFSQTFSRPDDSRRGDDKNFKTISRGQNYPYDRTNPDQSYGQPGGTDRHSGNREPGHSTIVPKDTSHSIWDDIAEAMGTPMLLTRGATSQIGSSVPGMGGFSKNPPKPWDESDVDDTEFVDMPTDEELEQLGLSKVEPSPSRELVVPAVQVSLSTPHGGMIPHRSAWDELLTAMSKNPFAEVNKRRR
jgi:hypothetical protein